LPVISPLIRMPWVTHAAARADTGSDAGAVGTTPDAGAATGADTGGGAGALDVTVGGTLDGLTSSFFHMNTPQGTVGFSKSSGWRAARLRNSKIVQGLEYVKSFA